MGEFLVVKAGALPLDSEFLMKILYTHLVAILFSKLPDANQLRECFPGLTQQGRSSRDGKPEEFNMLQGDGFSVIWNAATGESAEIDIQAAHWPDDHGAASGDGPTIVASHMGALGPGAGAGGLERACQQAWYWKEAGAAVARHTAFVGIRMCGGALEGNAESSPAGAKLQWMVESAARIAQLPGAIAFFNPGAEVVRTPEELLEAQALAHGESRPAVETFLAMRRWINDGWDLFDVVGMGQFDLPDMEFATPQGTLLPSDCFPCLANLCLYLIEKGDIMQTGHTVDGPHGHRWKAMKCAKSVAPPERPVIRWWPESGPVPPASLNPVDPIINSAYPEAGVSGAIQEVSKAIEEVGQRLADWKDQVARQRSHMDQYLTTQDAICLTVLAADTKTDRGIAKAMAGGVIIPVFPVIGSMDSSLPIRPTLTVGTFDTRLEAMVHAATLGSIMGEMYGAPPAEDSTERLLQKIVQDDRYKPKKRTRIPEPAADGFEIYAFNTLLRNDDPGLGIQGMATVFAQPGPKPGLILHLHSALLQGRTPPPVIPEIAPTSSGPLPPPLSGSVANSRAVPPSPPLSLGRRVWRIFKLFWIVVFLLSLLSAVLRDCTPDQEKKPQKSPKKATPPPPHPASRS